MGFGWVAVATLKKLRSDLSILPGMDNFFTEKRNYKKEELNYAAGWKWQTDYPE